MTENRYERATAIWLARKLKLDADKVSKVRFKEYYPGGGCETCGYGGEYNFAIEYYFDGSLKEYQPPYDLTPGKFIEECVEVLGRS